VAPARNLLVDVPEFCQDRVLEVAVALSLSDPDTVGVDGDAPRDD
jgi:hypothetical protein